MSCKMWTEDQKNAIYSRGGTVLVSAAAGSGKTACLVQRVIELITDKKNPCDADKMLIVTFTNAAAAEMRGRIAAILSEMISKNPGDPYLQRQQILLKRACIGTIHSFCNNVIRENFYRLGISQNFRISDENEMSILREQAINNVLEELYASCDPDFYRLVELFSNEKNDSGLIEIVECLYNFMRSHPFQDIWFEEKRALYKQANRPEDTLWGRTLLNYISEAVDCLCELIKRSLDISDSDESLKKSYNEALKMDLSSLRAIMDSMSFLKWDEALLKIQSFARSRRKKLAQGYLSDARVLEIECTRDYAKKVMDRLKKIFCFNEQRIAQDIKSIYPVVDFLFKIVKNFSDELDAIKLERNVADFSDLEQWMLKLLVFRDENGKVKKSETAIELSSQFEQVMVDEYQDVNEIQDMIFRAVSKDEQNLFMVGDIKQSIYRFRQATPEIFRKKKKEYGLYTQTNCKYPAKIILDRNFRSRNEIINSVNFTFNKLMSESTGDVDYSDGEELVYGASYSALKSPGVYVEIVEPSGEDETNDVLEARRIAEIIAQMIGEKQTVTQGETQRPVTYRDFCILLRSANKHAQAYSQELFNCGIPSWSDAGGKFFGTSEISIILSILRIVDNPLQDIPLIATLASPIFGFTPDDLSDVRMHKRDTPIYFALKSLCDSGDQRFVSFLEKLEIYRKISATSSCTSLISYIYDDTGYTSIVQAMQNGELRLANLRALLEYAKKYEGNVCRGLSGFIDFIDRLQVKKTDLSPASTVSETSNVVRIMSIHRSKGLEFPICILAGCSRRFNKEKGSVLIHPELGLGIKLRDNTSMIEYSNMIREAIAIQLDKESASEELRIFYVAMTRAKEKLFMIFTSKNLQTQVQKAYALGSCRKNIAPYVVEQSGSLAEWILLCAVNHPSGNKLRKLADSLEFSLNISDNMNKTSEWQINISCSASNSCDIHEPDQYTETGYDKELLNKMRRRFSFRYPHSSIEGVPLKIAASRLAQEGHWMEYIAFSKPSFMSGGSVTPAQKGTAMHEFLHFADYSEAAFNFDAHLKDLVEKGFLSQRQASLVNKCDAKRFLDGDLGKRIRKSSKLLREYRFTVGIPAEDDVYKSESEYNQQKVPQDIILVQGAIDCAFEEDGEYVIVDYKTDRVKDINELLKRYSKQLYIYKRALELCKRVKVKQLVIYSFSLGKWSFVPLNPVP